MKKRLGLFGNLISTNHYRTVNKVYLSTRIMSSVLPIDYTKWTKKDLIAKIRKLENGSVPGASTSLDTETKTDIETATATKLDQEQVGSLSTEGTNNGQILNPSDDQLRPKAKAKKRKEFDWSKQNMRFVAIKFAYLGWNYNGLAFQSDPTPLPTVEEIILKALAKVKLIREPIEEVEYSKCGRTDKGVSAMNQVISIKLRSNLTPQEQQDPAFDAKEVDYFTVINANLPADIKVHAICLRPPENFDARFSCKERHYRYLFRKTSTLDIDLMAQAAEYYEGLHDFRNFCKLDGSKQLTSFVRDIRRSKIIPLDSDGNLYCFDLIGNAFLWHQVRCMVAILFLVGQKLESPEIVKDLMDVTKFPTKPMYEMANDIPLVLYDCVFPEMEWKKFDLEYKFNRLHTSFRLLAYELSIQNEVTKIMENVLYADKREDAFKLANLKATPLGDGVGRAFSEYIPLGKRQRTDDYRIINARWLEKKAAKKAMLGKEQL